MHKQDQLTQGRHPMTRILLAATMLALIIGSMGQPVLAQGSTGISTFIQTSVQTKDICVHGHGSITVWVNREMPNISLDKDGNVVQPSAGPLRDIYIKRIGITITGEVADPGIAGLLQTSQITGFDLDLPEKVEFDLRGKKAGTTSVIFRAHPSTLPGEGLVGERSSPSNETNTRISVKVVDCKYKVTGIFRWRDAGGYALITAVTAETVITPDADGNFTGSASTTFTGYQTCIDQGVLPYAFTNPKVDLIGKVDDSGNVTVKMTFPPVGISVATTCYPIKVPGLTGNLAPLSVTVPSSGGSPEQSSVLSLAGTYGYTATGTAIIYVVPVDPSSGQ